MRNIFLKPHRVRAKGNFTARKNWGDVGQIERGWRMPETWNSDSSDVECPYCGQRCDMREPVAELEEDLHQWTCGNCDKEFLVRVHVSITVTAWEKEND
jgi:hypothetical protein